MSVIELGESIPALTPHVSLAIIPNSELLSSVVMLDDESMALTLYRHPVYLFRHGVIT